MLDIAINYKEQLAQKFRKVWFQEKYKFWNNCNYYEEQDISDSTWQKHQFVSLNSNGNVIGYIGYAIDRANEYAYSLNIINFTEDKLTFGMDVGKALTDIFERFHFRKLTFSVVIGNPIEKTYDKMIEKYGGRIVGYYKQHCKLIDGNFYDEKIYEIFSKDYFSKKK